MGEKAVFEKFGLPPQPESPKKESPVREEEEKHEREPTKEVPRKRDLSARSRGSEQPSKRQQKLPHKGEFFLKTL